MNGATMTGQQAAAYADRGEEVRTGKTPAERAAEWNSRWEQRYAPHYYKRDDGQRFPKPLVKPPPVRVGAGSEPQSAAVIRALERQINHGQLFSAEPVGEPYKGPHPP